MGKLWGKENGKTIKTNICALMLKDGYTTDVFVWGCFDELR